MSTTDEMRPAYVTAVEGSPRQTRTLMVNVHGSDVRWDLVDAENPSWGSGERPPFPRTAGSPIQLLILLWQWRRVLSLTTSRAGCPRWELAICGCVGQEPTSSPR